MQLHSVWRQKFKNQKSWETDRKEELDGRELLVLQLRKASIIFQVALGQWVQVYYSIYCGPSPDWTV